MHKKKILETKKQILQHTFDENEKNRNLSDAKYSNAKSDLNSAKSKVSSALVIPSKVSGLTKNDKKKIEKHQNLVDDAEANYNLNQQLEDDASSAKDKNRYETLYRE